MRVSGADELIRARLVGGYEAPGERAAEKASRSEPAEDREPGAVEKAFLYAGLSPDAAGKTLLMNAVFLCLCIAAAVLVRSGIPLTAAAGAALFQYFRLKKKEFGRTANFEKDYTAMLVSLSSSVRTGIDPLVALSQSDVLFDANSEMAKAIREFRGRIDAGQPEESAVRKFAATIRHPDLQLFRTAFILARKEGSSLGECLHRLARVTRQRQSFRRKVRAAVAMQKLSAVGIAGCALIIAIIQYSTNPAALNEAFNHPVGFKVLMGGVALIVLGLVWMLNMARSRI